jgi:hypothetical protein
MNICAELGTKCMAEASLEAVIKPQIEQAYANDDYA